MNLPWTREVWSRDSEEIWDDGLQGHNHTYGTEPEAIEWCFIRSGWCHDVSLDDWVLDAPDKHETRYLLCCEHLELVPDRSETCSLHCCKAYSVVPEGYNWLWGSSMSQIRILTWRVMSIQIGQAVPLIGRALWSVASVITQKFVKN